MAPSVALLRVRTSFSSSRLPITDSEFDAEVDQAGDLVDPDRLDLLHHVQQSSTVPNRPLVSKYRSNASASSCVHVFRREVLEALPPASEPADGPGRLKVGKGPGAFLIRSTELRR